MVEEVIEKYNNRWDKTWSKIISRFENLRRVETLRFLVSL
jgi:hypothetical protein